MNTGPGLTEGCCFGCCVCVCVLAGIVETTYLLCNYWSAGARHRPVFSGYSSSTGDCGVHTHAGRPEHLRSAVKVSCLFFLGPYHPT